MGRPRGTGGKAQELSPLEVRRVDRCMVGTRHEYRNRAMLYIGLVSGLRLSKLVGITLGDVQVNGQPIRQIVLDKHRTKSKRSRTVHLSDQAYDFFQAYLASGGFDGRPNA